MNLESFRTNRYQLDIEFDSILHRIVLTDLYSGVVFADSEYRYSLFTEYDDEIVHLEGLYEPTLDEVVSARGHKIVTLRGRIGKPESGVDVRMTQQFNLRDNEEYLEENISLRNASKKDIVLRGYRFGFRKHLNKPKKYGGPGMDIDEYRLIALPFRLQPDGKKHDYQLDDLYHGRYQTSEFYNPARLVQEVVDKNRARSEGWAWTNGEHGLLVVKYNQEAIEYSMLDTEHRDGHTYLTFGGASPSLYNEPTQVRHLQVGSTATFGTTRFHFYEGLWRRGAYMFREFMSTRGHGIPENYDPPIHWNELYDIGWHHNNKEALAKHYTLETMEHEAEKAREIGCDSLYLDPGWETCEGATIWDEERLGKVDDFVRKIKEDYGLEVAFRTIGRSYCDSYPGMYRRRADGSIGYYAPYDPKPFYETCIASEQYQQEKMARLKKLVDAGMNFIMLDEFDWRGPCYNPKHGHPIPTTPDMHARAVMDLARKLHETHPELLIEVHDPIWSWGPRYLPVYYLHDSNSFNEAWAFEFMWNPLEDLLSGKALSLMYYNLAYEVPLYLHMNMDYDNDNCLAFWWYASTVRHIGIGGKKGNDKRFQAYKEALSEYKSMKNLYTRGRFYATDELTHIHVIPEEGQCVVNAFNLTDTHTSRKVEVRLGDFGLVEDINVDGTRAEIVGTKVVLDLDIPPFSPKIVKISFRQVGSDW
ncbi:hypothetical protein LLG39_09185 [bacterium]|nr:hypothetical protein [bacterium]